MMARSSLGFLVGDVGVISSPFSALVDPDSRNNGTLNAEIFCFVTGNDDERGNNKLRRAQGYLFPGGERDEIGGESFVTFLCLI